LLNLLFEKIISLIWLIIILCFRFYQTLRISYISPWEFATGTSQVSVLSCFLLAIMWSNTNHLGSDLLCVAIGCCSYSHWESRMDLFYFLIHSILMTLNWDRECQNGRKLALSNGLIQFGFLTICLSVSHMARTLCVLLSRNCCNSCPLVINCCFIESVHFI